MAFKLADLRNSERMEIMLGNLLRGGVILSFAVVSAGALLFLIRHGHELPRYHAFRGEPEHLRNVPGIFVNAFDLSGRGIIQLGILLLIATPVVRVAFSVAAFALQRDRTYVVITLIVLSLLLYSLVGCQA